jgi:hypothetical protein
MKKVLLSMCLLGLCNLALLPRLKKVIKSRTLQKCPQRMCHRRKFPPALFTLILLAALLRLELRPPFALSRGDPLPCSG